MDIGSWLAGLGLQRYAAAFRDNAIDMDVLVDLTEQDLSDLGVLLGDRKRMIRALKTRHSPPEAGPAPVLKTEPVSAPTDDPEAEIRHLTVMFIDLVGSTRLSGILDPEEMRDLIRAYQNVVAGEVSRFDGYVAKFMGDGVLCYFGFPTAHEDDARNAVHAGKAIIRSMSRITAVPGEAAQVRIGVASGIVMVGEIIGEAEARERDVVGETPNIAARLQTVANPGEIVVADTTRRLIGQAYLTAEADLPPLKGISDTLRAHRILDEIAIEDQRAALGAQEGEGFVGRQDVIGGLRALWDTAPAGGVTSVLLTGEAGIGKSKVVQHFVDGLGLPQRTRFTLHGSSYHQQTALHPVIEALRRLAGIAVDDPDEAAVGKLRTLLADFLTGCPDAGANFSSLLGLDHARQFEGSDMAPFQIRTRTLSQLSQFLVNPVDTSPRLIVVEDAHWLDHSTIELLSACMKIGTAGRTLIVLTARTGAAPPDLTAIVDHEVKLDRLDRAATCAIVAELTGNKAFPEDLVQEIVDKTDGVPLFVRELTKMIVESDLVEETDHAFHLVGPLSALSIPSTLHDSLMARLDRLHGAKRTAQIAACIGRQFDLDVLAAITSANGGGFREALSELVEAKLVDPPDGTDPVYSFRHALVRDAAYASLLKSQRKAIHERVARALAGRSVSPETLAHHFECAEQPVRAAENLLLAGQNALRLCAAHEAITHFQRGIGLLTLDEMTSETKLLKMRMFGLLGTGFMLTKSWGAQEVQHAYGKALDLVDETDNPRERIWIVWGAWVFAQVQGNLIESEAQARRALPVATQGADDDVSLIAQVIMLQTAFYKGRWREALGHGEQIERLYDPHRHGALRDDYSLDLLLVWYVHGSQASWMIGDFTQARALRAKADAHGRNIAHSHSRAWVAVWGANLSLLEGDEAHIRDTVPAAVELCDKYGFSYVGQLGKLLLSATRLASHPEPDAFAAMDDAFERFQSTGAGIAVPYFLGFKAQALLRAGQHDEAARTSEAAIRLIAERGESWSEPRAHRIGGDILAAAPHPDPDLVIAAYTRAVDASRAQGAVVWGVQAELALYRFLREINDLDGATALSRPLLAARARLRQAARDSDSPTVRKLLSALQCVNKEA